MCGLLFAPAALLGMSTAIAPAQAPAALNPATGVRPGHELGVGAALPLSNNASDITRGVPSVAGR